MESRLWGWGCEAAKKKLLDRAPGHTTHGFRVVLERVRRAYAEQALYGLVPVGLLFLDVPRVRLHVRGQGKVRHGGDHGAGFGVFRGSAPSCKQTREPVVAPEA